MNTTTTTTAPICRDCLYFETQSGQFLIAAHCGRTIPEPDLVTGALEKRFCSAERISERPECCGPAGRFFAPDDTDIIP